MIFTWKFVRRAFCATVAVLGASAMGAPAAPLTLDPAAILAAHNKLRAEVGVPPLRWSDKLAQGAAQWARTVASLNRMQYSGTTTVGENMAVMWGGNRSLSQMIAIWSNEKSQFQRGVFPQISRTGDENAVLHYSQMIWRGTTEVGCGAANSGQSDFLVCWYSPQGNFIGQAPY
jgi:hypothetical protein